ncbi:MAG: NUDIX domain-containing protein [bacterium]|nr:NUDIX domain-containing protein [bacterium]
MKSKFTIGIVGIIFDRHKHVLLCHRCDYDLWSLPGGGLERGESPWEGVKREIKEETGFDTDIVSLAGVYSKPDVDEVVLSFICKVSGGEITLNDEADKIEYFDVGKLPQNISEKQVERIRDALAFPDKTVYKVQTGKSKKGKI